MNNKIVKESYLDIQNMKYNDRNNGREIVLKGVKQKTYEYGFATQYYKVEINGKNIGFRRIWWEDDDIIKPYIHYKGVDYRLDLFTEVD